MEGDTNLKVVKYDRTPIMSTYLMAFIVGEYDYVEGKDSDGVLVRVYTPVGKKEQGQFALEVILRSISHLNLLVKKNIRSVALIYVCLIVVGCSKNLTLLQRLLQDCLSTAKNRPDRPRGLCCW